jgi:hypothetical protein
MPTLAARHGGKRWQITGNENLGVARAARHHPQWAFVAHELKIAAVVYANKQARNAAFCCFNRVVVLFRDKVKA